MTDPADYGVLFEAFPQHAEMLAASGITPDHARARGYVPVDTKVRLEQLGITKTGRNVPGLLVPQLRAAPTKPRPPTPISAVTPPTLTPSA